MEDRRPPKAMLVMVSVTVLGAAIVLGGPRTGYIPGTIVATTAIVWLDRRFELPASTLWVLVAVAVTYFAGGTIVIGGDTLSHQSFGIEPLRYDHLLHAFAAGVSVHVLWLGTTTKASTRSRLVDVVAFASLLGVAVEVLEVMHAVAMPSLFHYDVADSVRDLIGNTVGIAIGVAMLRSRPAEPRVRDQPAAAIVFMNRAPCWSPTPPSCAPAGDPGSSR